MNAIISDNTPKIFFDEIYITFSPTHIHTHGHSEIQVVGDGNILLTVNNQKIRVGSYEAVLIPANAFHSTECDAPPARFFSFHLEHPISEGAIIKIPKDFAEDFFKKLQQGISENTPSLYINQIMFITAELINNNKATKIPEDYKYIINEFFSHNYNKNITVANMANELSLSAVQTQRIIKQHTGKTFGENLLEYRMTVANNLIETTDMTMEQIASYVGYSTYSGFWKAHKKYTGKL